MSTSPSNDPKNIDDLLAAGSRRRPPQPPTPAPTPAPVPIAAPLPVATSTRDNEPEFVRGTYQLSTQNDQYLHQLSYHTPGRKGDKSYIVNEALDEYFAKRPKCREAIPPEDAVRRRGRRHH